MTHASKSCFMSPLHPNDSRQPCEYAVTQIRPRSSSQYLYHETLGSTLFPEHKI